jgi:predicted 3-demethylubiquinone-9 3-methyltransferase (glyoxalase superfamily)
MDGHVKQPFSFTPATSFFVTCPSAAEVDRLHDALSQGGSVLMALDRYPFAARYAWVQDRFGVSWQLFFR